MSPPEIGTTSSGYTFSTIYSFRGPPNDGANPIGGVTIDSRGDLYGTTFDDGSSTWCSLFDQSGCGIVFELTPSGSTYQETVLHVFSGASDGGLPDGTPVLDRHSNVYGITYGGGAGCDNSGCGTVFRISGDGKRTKTTLYRFRGPSKQDGEWPYGSVVLDRAGNIYGTTSTGGRRGGGCSTGCGTVYRLSKTSTGYLESILHSFAGGTDGDAPQNGVAIDERGDLVGTTSAGGHAGCGVGCGTVYKLVRSGDTYREEILYAFPGRGRGWDPGEDPVLLDSVGDVFGVTYLGGNARQYCTHNGCGTIYEILNGDAG